jgi:2-keto-3-deoxy-L-rhamnonate aldolase RhmA
MGIPGQFGDPRVHAIYARVAAAAKRHGKFLRFGGTEDPRLIKGQIEAGSRLVMLGSDLSCMIAGMDHKMRAIEDAAGPSDRRQERRAR